MKKTKHTPGPWAYDEKNAEILPGPGTDKNSVGRFHAGREDAGQDARPTKADALVIAAAPELLEACRGVLALDEPGAWDDPERRIRAWNVVRHAVAKADGK